MTPANDNRPAAFDTALLAHEPYIRSRLYVLEKDTTKHDDLYQDIIAKALEQWPKYRPEGNFAGWLYYVAYSVVHKRDRSLLHGPDLRVTEPTQEYVTDISLALDRCTEEVLLSACGHSEAEIARRAGVTPAAAHYRIKAARAAMVAANDNNKKAA
jgi:DNA-directed RNA polymerase specialized sigma24 family protein